MNPQLQTLKRKNSLRGARVLITAIAIFLGSFLITGMARADVPKDPFRMWADFWRLMTT